MAVSTAPAQALVGLDIDDPVQLEVVRNSLVSICEEMGVAMMRTSYSTMFNEARDFSCVVFDARGEMIAQGDFCPAHIGAIVHTVEWAIKEVGPEHMQPGDVILHNDPYRGGCHLPEFMTLRPCFYQGQVVAYAANIAHMTEIGGMVPAAFGDTRNIFQEGLRLPPIKIFRDNRPVEDIFAIITSNVRTPKVSRGDLMAMSAPRFLAERRVVELVEKVGVDRFTELAGQIKDVSEVMMRAAISKLPDGEYAAEGIVEDDGVIADNPYKFVARIVVRGDEIIVDYTGSDAQAAGAINQSFGTTASATYATIFHMIDDPIPWNHGAYRPIGIVAPPGDGDQCELPARASAETRIPTRTRGHAVRGVLADQRAQPGMRRRHQRSAGSVRHLHRHRRAVRAAAHRGHGLRRPADADGNDAMVTKNGNCLNSPCEVLETRLSGSDRGVRLATESPGPGAHRGGHGVERIWRCLAPITISAHVNRTWFKPWGLRAANRPGTQGCCSSGRARIPGSRRRSCSRRSRPGSSRTWCLTKTI